jgi:hypothetical protein
MRHTDGLERQQERDDLVVDDVVVGVPRRTLVPNPTLSDRAILRMTETPSTEAASQLDFAPASIEGRRVRTAGEFAFD